MAVSLFAQSAVVAAAGSPMNLTYPASIAAGDMIVVGVGLKSVSASSSISGYVVPTNGDQNGGAGSTGIDTGPVRQMVHTKEAAGTETGTLAVTLTTVNVAWGIILVYRKAGGTTWDTACVGAVDTTTGTPFTATMASDPGFETGDMCAVFGCIPTDVGAGAQFSAESLTATGLTATVAELAEPTSALGQDIGGLVCNATVTGGPSAGVPTFSATAGGTTTNVAGPIVLFRLREVSAAAAEIPDVVMAPMTH